jgi:hypothetical protein
VVSGRSGAADRRDRPGQRADRARLGLLGYSGPVSNDQVSLQFSQQVNGNDALRTGNYAKTLTFTLATTTP